MRIVNSEALQDTKDPNDSLWQYNGLDCCVTLEVLNAIEPQLDPVTQRTYDFSRALQGPVLEMSMRGLLVDRLRRDQVLEQLRSLMKRIEDQLDLIVKDGIGEPKLNWRSPKQLSVLFYEILNLSPVYKRSSTTGHMAKTTDRSALEKLSDYFIAEPLCNRLMLLKDLDKQRQFLETPIDSDGRMRTNFNIAGTRTGRLASAMSDFGTGGNLQNVDAALRSIFIADPGMMFAEFDLEQADARNVGAICWNLFHKSHGPTWAGAYLDACESGDLHSAVAKMVWPNEEPLSVFHRGDTRRQACKKLGHASNYMVTPKTAATQTKIPIGLIKDFQDLYFKKFPCILSWHQAVARQLRQPGYLTSLMGRRRGFFGRSDSDDTLREAVAYDPQSATADEIDTGIIKLFRANRVQLLLQVHDSVLIQFPREQVDEIVPWVRETLKVPIELAAGRHYCVPVGAKVGGNWGDGLAKYKG